MPVPYLGNAMKGWTKRTNIKIITQTVVDHETTESESDVVCQANFQPMPAAKVDRKPEEQRTWKWWSIIVQSKTLLLSTDDIIQDYSGKKFRIEEAEDWRESGFSNYEVKELMLLKELAKHDIMHVLIEGGAKINSSFLKKGLIDRIIFMIAPKIIGGKDSIGVFEGIEKLALNNAIQLKDIKVRRFGEDICVETTPKSRPKTIDQRP